MTTEAADTTAAAPKGSWRLETANGSMSPRSALDVLVDLNDKVASGKVDEYQPVPLGFTPLDKTIGSGLRAGRAAADRRRPGHRQDHDGAPDGPQHGLRRPGERALHLLRARGAVPAQPAHRDGVGARPPARTRPARSRSRTSARRSSGLDRRGRSGSPQLDEQPAPAARRSTGSPATGRTCSCCAARRPPARSTTSAAWSSSTASCRASGACVVVRRLHAEGAGHPRSRRPSPRR